MKVIILGAGQVGSSVAANLVGEANDITVVDHNEKLLQGLQNHLDLQTVIGFASHPDVLRQAGAEDADMLLAVTNSDETNMVACQIASVLFHIPTKIARVRENNYLRHPEIFAADSLGVDLLISPEELVTHHTRRLIDYPDALQVLDFAKGRVQMVAVRVSPLSSLIGHDLRALGERIPGVDTRVVAIYRRGKAIIPDGEEMFEAGDEVFYLAAREHVLAVMAELRQVEKPVKRIIIGGGGNIGQRLAENLEQDYHVKLIESNPDRTHVISAQLNQAIVLEGDVADEELLREARIQDTDVFCALTNDDQVNILAAMLAKRLGARKVIALINRAAYVDLVESSTIDIAISPQQITIGTLLAYVRRGDVEVVHALRRGAAEAIEAVAHGDSVSSKVVGKTVEQVDLPTGVTMGAIVRGDEVFMAHHDSVIESEDHVILFLADKSRIRQVERLFQVGITFF